MPEPDALELQAHAVMTAMESAHKVIVEDFWQRDGRAWLKYYHPDDGKMWTLTLTPWPMDADPQPEIEWGVRHSGTAVPYPDKAHARRVRDRLAGQKPHLGAELVWREKGRPAGPWTEVTGEAPDA